MTPCTKRSAAVCVSSLTQNVRRAVDGRLGLGGRNYVRLWHWPREHCADQGRIELRTLLSNPHSALDVDIGTPHCTIGRALCVIVGFHLCRTIGLLLRSLLRGGTTDQDQATKHRY